MDQRHKIAVIVAFSACLVSGHILLLLERASFFRGQLNDDCISRAYDKIHIEGVFVTFLALAADESFMEENVASWSPAVDIYIIGIDGWMGHIPQATPCEMSFEISFYNHTALDVNQAEAYIDGRIYKWDLHRHGAGTEMLQRELMFPSGTGIFIRSTDTLYFHRCGWNGGDSEVFMGDIECTIYYVKSE
jgi:hypothetical protein